MKCRLLHDGSHSGAWNMAVDAAILGTAVGGDCTIRFYEWSTPTVSLGHFQVRGQGAIPDRFSGLPWIRRLSGGGAILHDRELTYSIGLPAAHPVAKRPSTLYEVVHEAIIQILADRGIRAQLRGDVDVLGRPFLCFARGDARDIVMGPHKIVGSAQRRRSGAILQHGSILLAKSPYAPEFPGLNDLIDAGAVTAADLIADLNQTLPIALGVEASDAALNVNRQQSLSELCDDPAFPPLADHSP